MAKKALSQRTKSSADGTTLCDQTSALDGSSIIKIITACRENGVRQFKYQSLELQLDVPQDAIHIAPEDSVRVAQDTEVQEYRMRQEELELLRLSDPFRYEELMKQNELDMSDA